MRGRYLNRYVCECLYLCALFNTCNRQFVLQSGFSVLDSILVLFFIFINKAVIYRVML